MLFNVIFRNVHVTGHLVADFFSLRRSHTTCRSHNSMLISFVVLLIFSFFPFKQYKPIVSKYSVVLITVSLSSFKTFVKYGPTLSTEIMAG